MTTESLLEKLHSRLSPEAARALSLCIASCEETALSLYLVGGAVRDLLLDNAHLDLDLAVEGNVEDLGRELARRTGGRAVFHPRFGTATVRGRGFQLDLAMTRRETYERHGALPTVEPALLIDDLARRDFSINALALRLTAPAGELIDAFGGVADLHAGLIRALHERSFQDDATRMLRATRYAARLHFVIEPLTRVWLEQDLAYLDTVSGPRLRHELMLMFEEECAVDAALLAAGLSLLPRIYPGLRLDDHKASAWREALTGPRHGEWDELGFCLLADPTDHEAVRSLAVRLHLAGRFERALSDLVRLHALSDKLATDSPSEVVGLLDGLAISAVWAYAVLAPGKAGEAGRRYLEEWRRVRPALRGDDLLTLGVSPGPAVGEMLKELRAARLEGRVANRADEVDFVQRSLGLTERE
jgi:tRNA nucleotidyltransferase (CCA-adding enzyme)